MAQIRALTGATSSGSRPAVLAAWSTGEADGTEGHRNGVGDQGGKRRAQLAEADADEHRRGDGDRCTESGEGFQKAAEAEGDQDAQHPRDRR